MSVQVVMEKSCLSFLSGSVESAGSLSSVNHVESLTCRARSNSSEGPIKLKIFVKCGWNDIGYVFIVIQTPEGWSPVSDLKPRILKMTQNRLYALKDIL